MRYRRALVLITVLGVLAAACGDGDSTGTTESPDTTGSADTTTPDTTETPPTTVEEQTTTTGQAPESVDLTYLGEFDFGHACFFSAHHIFVEAGFGDAAAELLNDSGIVAVHGYIDNPLEDLELAGEPDLSLFDGAVDIVTIADGSPNAFLVSEFLLENGFFARPVHMIGMTGHWQVKPGNDPEAVDEELLWEPDSSPDGSATLAVVDTRLVQSEYDWVLDGVNHDGTGSVDPHDLGASHGTFIVSLIRQVLPELNVAFASLPANPKSTTVQAWPEDALTGFTTNNVTTEIPAYVAIYGLIERLFGREVVPEALSLSWGTYPCESQFFESEDVPIEDEMAALAATIAAWDAAFGPAPVFAAAGNEPPIHGPFYPAAFPEVVGVAADGGNGALVWDHTNAVVETLEWADVYAEGCDLVGVSGSQEPGPVVAWGGSSFATPLAALAWIAAGLPPQEASAFDPTEIFGVVPQVDLGRC